MTPTTTCQDAGVADERMQAMRNPKFGSQTLKYRLARPSADRFDRSMRLGQILPLSLYDPGHWCWPYESFEEGLGSQQNGYQPTCIRAGPQLRALPSFIESFNRVAPTRILGVVIPHPIHIEDQEKVLRARIGLKECGTRQLDRDSVRFQAASRLGHSSYLFLAQ